MHTHALLTCACCCTAHCLHAQGFVACHNLLHNLPHNINVELVVLCHALVHLPLLIPVPTQAPCLTLRDWVILPVASSLVEAVLSSQEWGWYDQMMSGEPSSQ
jgi:hypothetical protein